MRKEQIEKINKICEVTGLAFDDVVERILDRYLNQNIMEDKKMIQLFNGDCLEVMEKLIEEGVKVDLVLIDPPYEIKNTKAGGKSELAKSIQGANDDIENSNLTKGYDYIETFKKLKSMQDKTNIYIWCNKAQIPLYLDWFVTKNKCSFDIIKWVKTNAIPNFYNKYKSDTEYCLYFRKGGLCMPHNSEDASTLFLNPINIKDKKLFGHPTIKPVEILERLIRNSTKENGIVLDCFMGSGSTGVACKNLNRKFIGIELDKKYFEIAKKRIQED